MAEQFHKPNPFTKEWFSYIWCYYKVHILSVFVVILLVGITIFEILNMTEYDMNINYIATNMLEATTAGQLCDRSEKEIQDISGDGEVHTSFVQLNFTPESVQDGNQVMALESRLMTMFASPDEMMFIFDKMMLQDVLSLRATEGIFLPVSEWCTAQIPQDKLFLYEADAYAVSLSDSAFLKELGVDASDMYVAVRMNYDPEDEKLNAILANCIDFANVLLK